MKQTETYQWFEIEREDPSSCRVPPMDLIKIACPICHDEDISNWKGHCEECFFICDCGETIKRRKEEKYHSQICPKLELCILCGTFVVERDWIKHSTHHKQSDQMTCPLCNEQVSIRHFMQDHWIPHIEYHREKQKEIQKILENNTKLLSNMITLTGEMYHKIYKDHLFEEETSATISS
jgi:hypothetical protein